MYRGGTMGGVKLVLIGWAAAAVWLGLLWFWQKRRGDAGIADVGWASGVGLLALWYAWAGDGLPGRRLLVAALTGVWAARLAWYLLSDRVLEGPDGEGQ